MVKEAITKKDYAFASSKNLPISTKHSVEISKFLRYKRTTLAKSFLEDVIALKKPVPFRKFKRDIGHKKGMAAGRFPQKAAKEFLHLIKSAEANALFKGLDSSNLKITTLIANKASVPFSGGRKRQGTKRTHLEIALEGAIDNKKKDKKEAKPKSEATKVKSVVAETKKEKPTEKVTEEVNVPVSPEHEETKVEDLSSEQLLEKAQEKADKINKQEAKKENVEEIEGLYDELKKKGTLRDTKTGAKK